jgi:hypothetical protein
MRAVDIVNFEWVAKTPWEFKHPQAFARLRCGSGVVLLLMTAILYGYDRAPWWTPLIGASGLVSLWGAHRIPRTIAARQSAIDAQPYA